MLFRSQQDLEFIFQNILATKINKAWYHYADDKSYENDLLSDNYSYYTGDFNYQYYTNNGAHTIVYPSTDCAIDILITNGASAGSITFSGFTANAGNVGDTYDTGNGNRFILMVRRINGISTYVFKALQ